ncbi:hypothetical protein K5N30_002720 [Vibrio parahaemolyticus]|nr:hypothetical protein [Vibrio parahaemolyticus]
MSNSDNITKQEADTIKNSIIHIEAGDHLITDEAKRHKLALMLACAFVFMISLYPTEHLGSLFGIVKFTDETKIKLFEVLPYALLVMIYQGIMYAYHFNEAKKAWINKKLKMVREDNVKHLVILSEVISSKQDNIAISHPKPIDIESEVSPQQLSTTLGTLIKNVESINSDWSQKLEICNELSALKNYLLDIHRISNNTNHLNIHELDELETKIKEKLTKIHSIIPSENWAIDKAIILQTCHENLERYVKTINHIFIDKYNLHLEMYLEQELESVKYIKDSNKQINNIAESLQKTSFNENLAMILYVILPSVIFSVVFLFGMKTYLSNI